MGFLVSYLDEYFQRQWLTESGFLSQDKTKAALVFAGSEKEAINKAASMLVTSGVYGILRIKKDWLEAEIED